ncbi:MAG TPA: hypothetical protein P5256_00870 [Beijerinckiaceae bacterium]|jgi:hypothetical protein|nr:hypothetical protein [Rhodoblastus sp.]MCB1533384.1 hypothetical protein [Rhodoblastus sp.]MCC2106105.1 hypothetical protein [Hyphomicrobiales bacterium]HRY01646.1 hypothetical protein [Beijerinckiaceae bacterium]
MNHMSPKPVRSINPHALLDDDNFPEFDPNDPANAHIVDQVMSEMEREAEDMADAREAARPHLDDRARQQA